MVRMSAVGRLGADPVSNLLPSRLPVVHVPLLCKDRRGVEVKVNLNVYGRLALRMERQAKKGDLIAVEGDFVTTEEKVWQGGIHLFQHLDVYAWEMLK